MKFHAQSVLAVLIASVALQPLQSHAMDHVVNFAYEHKMALAAAASATAVGVGSHYLAKNIHERNIHWDWNNISATSIGGKPMAISEFFKNEAKKVAQLQEPQRSDAPQNQWLWGAATAAHQVEGYNTNNQWFTFEGEKLDGRTVQPAGTACDALNHIDEDVQRMVDFGLNSYRFSIEWSKLIPKADGVVNQEYLEKIKYLCKKLQENNIKPCVTLYHYTEPIWFHEIGGFEKAQNIQHFVKFCTTAFAELHDSVYLWFTFNAPEGVAAQGWLTGAKPPAKKDMRLMARVLHNILESHVQVYQAIKKMDGGQQSRIGILKNIMQLDPWRFGHPVDHICCYFATEVVDNSVYRFLTNGTFSINIPKGVKTTKVLGIPVPTGIDWVMDTQVNEYIKNGGKCLDFVGLNYYCHNYMKGTKSFREPDQTIEIHANNDRYTIYGEGLYRALKTLSTNVAQPLKVPIYVTENGIGTDNDEHRIKQSQRYLRALAQARTEGVDVRGYIHWSLMDNYEWGRYDKHYGLFKVDCNSNDLTRTQKPGAAYYEAVVKGQQYKPAQS